MLHSRTRLAVLALALAAGGVAFGAKLMLIRSYGSDVPYMDEWDAVGRVLLVPKSLGQLHPANFLEPQNEHRVVLSRLISYGLIGINGQWDGLLEMTAGALLHAAFCSALVLYARQFLSGWRAACATLFITLLFVLVYDWENTLQGFQNQFYLLEWGAFAVCLLCIPGPVLGMRWWLGWLAGLASLGSMSSGFLAALVALLVLLVRAARTRRLTAKESGSGLLLAALCIGGGLTLHHVPGHDVLKASSAGQWLVTAATALSWPKLDWPVAWMVLQLPIVVLAVGQMRGRRLAGQEVTLVAIGLWVWLQQAAVAYARANLGMVASSRYSDLYAVGAVVNALALLILWGPGRAGRPWAALALLWLTLFLCGLWNQEQGVYRNILPNFARNKLRERQHVRAFLQTGGLGQLKAAPIAELPYPQPEVLAAFLSNPTIRSVLPSSIRLPLGLSAAADSEGFERTYSVELGEKTWTAQRGPARFVSTSFSSGVLPCLCFSARGGPLLGKSVFRFEPTPGEVAPGADLDGDHWRPVNLVLPSGAPEHLVVDLPTAGSWISFTEPVEMGWASADVRWLLRRAGWVCGLSALFLGVALTTLFVFDLRRERA